MNHLRSAFEKHLSRLNRLGVVMLGEDKEEDIQSITLEDNQLFIQNINAQQKFNNRILIIYITLICILFAVGIFLVFHNLNSPDRIGIIFGGTFLSLLGVIERLRRLWREKSFADITLIVLKELPPKESLRVIEILYWNSIRKQRSKRLDN